MTTAKNQQSGSQPDSADDLIAELSKLMAQDPRGEATRSPEPQQQEPSAPPAEPRPMQNRPPVENFDLRLPNTPRQSEQTGPSPRFDFSRSDRNATPQGAPANPPQSVGPTGPEAGGDNDVIGDLIAAELANGQTQRGQAPVDPVPTQQQRSPEREGEDSFRIAPVFGLDAPAERADVNNQRAGASPAIEPSSVESVPVFAAPPAPRERPVETPATPRDSKQEIESLIGDAARIDASGRPPGRSAPSPALRSLATPVLPTARPQSRSTAPAPGPVAESAEDAILAAAAATGARVGWIDPGDDDEMTPPPPPRASRPRGGFPRAIVGPSVALVLLLIAGGALYWVLGTGGDDGPPPLLSADAEPVKEEPEAVAEEPTRESAVFNEIDGVSTPEEEEALVSRDQSLEGEISDEPPADDDSGLVNRRVRTVTVRPDGTIVSGETGLAGAAELPVDRPNVPDVGADANSDTTEVATADTESDTSQDELTGDADTVGSDGIGALLQAEGAGGPDSDADADASAIADLGEGVNGIGTGDADAAGSAALEPLVAGEPATAVNTDGEPIPGVTVPVPMGRIQRSSDPIGPIQLSQPSSPANAVIQTPAAANDGAGTGQAATNTEAPAESGRRTLFGDLFGSSDDSNAAAPTSSSAPAYVQLSSQRSEEAARQTANDIVSRYGNLFGGRSLEVQRVDLGEQGVYYRVRLPAESSAQATQICNSVRSSGGDCFTL